MVNTLLKASILAALLMILWIIQSIPQQIRIDPSEDKKQKIEKDQIENLPDEFQKEKSISDIDTSKIDINVDPNEQKLPDINDSNTPDVDQHLQGIISIISSFFHALGQAIKCIFFGFAIGALVPVGLFLFLFALGFTVGGIAAGSIAAFCQSSAGVNFCFSILQSVGATAGALRLTPYTAVLGAFGGLIYFFVTPTD